MKQAVPVLTVLAALVVLWYAASVWMNSTWVYDQAARAGESPTLMQVIPQTMAQDRPLLPPPHQVAARLWEGLAGQAVTSKRSLVYHGFVTFRGTMAGFALGIVLGVGLAMAIVRFRVMDMSVMPWAIISQTIPIVAIAPMILVVSNQLGIQGREVPKAIIASYLSFFPVLVSMVKGLRAPDQMQLDLLKTWGASEGQTFRKLRLPASMPYFFASLKVAITVAFVGSIISETVAANEGIGHLMLVASSRFDVPLVFAGLIVTGVMGVLMYWVAVTIEERTTGWATRGQNDPRLATGG